MGVEKNSLKKEVLRVGKKLQDKLPDYLYRLSDTIIHKNEAEKGGLDFLANYYMWHLSNFIGWSKGKNEHKELTVILLSYKRIRNMLPIARAILRLPFVKKIIISNNNPDYDIGDWVTLHDQRLICINQKMHTAPGIRFALAMNDEADFFISIDDDVFLYPCQIKILFDYLKAHPENPVGVQGENYCPDASQVYGKNLIDKCGWVPGLFGFHGSVDVINRVYGFTKTHMEKMHVLSQLLNIDITNLYNGEDILLSVTGESRPQILEVGRLFACLTQNRYGVATWATRNNFFAERAELYKKLRGLKSLEVTQLKETVVEKGHKCAQVYQ